MTKLIDADETTKAIIKRLGIGSERYLLPSERAIVDVIESMPTVDAEPVRHECHHSQYSRRHMPKYCPNCGANMNGKKDTGKNL